MSAGSHFQRVKELFHQGLEIAPGQRECFFQKEQIDAATLAEVYSLLDAHGSDDSFLDSPLNNRQDSEQDRWVGQTISDFELREVIGTGGNATVYRAVQKRPHRSVALKLIHQSRNDPESIKRFHEESDTLAKLDHPGIARVLASGQHDDAGVPRCWIAMELIDGVSLKEYLVENSLSLLQKLELFREICVAVTHVHDRGIIHRDLKPSNILVSKDSTQLCRPILIDFGIARVTKNDLLGEDNRDHTMTADGTVLGTLSHMSPEQLSGDVSRVTQASDVYSLGVIGYEMIAGQPPLNMSRGSLLDVIQRGIHDDPILLGKLLRECRGDIEAIFFTALQKEPSKRYVSAAAMAADVEDHLAGRGVSVKKPGWCLRVARFVNRNRGPVAAATGMLAIAIAGVAFYFQAAQNAIREAEKSRYEADKAIAVNSFITNDILTSLIASIDGSQGNSRDEIDQTLDQRSEKVSAMFGHQPLIEAAIRNELGTIRYNLGQLQDAQSQYRMARQIWKARLGESHPDTLKASNNLGLCLMRLGQGDDAEELLEAALEGREKVLGPMDPQTLATMNNLAQLLSDSGRPDEATEMLNTAFERQIKTKGFDDQQSLILAANLGSLMLRRGEQDAASALHQRVYESCQSELGEDHVTTLLAGFRYADTLHKLGQFESAASILRPLHEPSKRFVSSQSLTLARLLSRIERDLGNLDQAIRVLEIAELNAEQDPDRFESQIQKIKRDIRRLARTRSD